MSDAEQPGSPTAAVTTLRTSQAKWAELKGRLVVTQPWPSMARTVWGDVDMAATPGWVGAPRSKAKPTAGPESHTSAGWLSFGVITIGLLEYFGCVPGVETSKKYIGASILMKI